MPCYIVLFRNLLCVLLFYSIFFKINGFTRSVCSFNRSLFQEKKKNIIFEITDDMLNKSYNTPPFSSKLEVSFFHQTHWITLSGILQSQSLLIRN